MCEIEKYPLARSLRKGIRRELKAEGVRFVDLHYINYLAAVFEYVKSIHTVFKLVFVKNNLNFIGRVLAKRELRRKTELIIERTKKKGRHQPSSG